MEIILLIGPILLILWFISVSNSLKEIKETLSSIEEILKELRK